MQTEIERKFLVRSEAFKAHANKSYGIRQGFLTRDPQRTVRIRIKDDKGYITVKGISSQDGLSRLEWETEIKRKDAEDLLQLCEGNLLEKTRYEIAVDRHMFEVDVFHGQHKGLIIAEIELQNKDEGFTAPDWLGKEVTGDKAYYNSQL